MVQRTMGSSVTPATQAGLAGTVQNLHKQQEADLQQQQLNMQQTLQEMQLADNKEARDAAAAQQQRAIDADLHKVKLTQEGWDKNRVHEDQMLRRRLNQEKEMAALEKRLMAIRARNGENTSNRIANLQSAATQYHQSNPAPVGVAGHERMADWNRNFNNFTQSSLKRIGNHSGRLATQNAKLNRNVQQFEQGMINATLAVQSQLLGFNTRRSDFRNHLGNVNNNIYASPDTAMRIFTSVDPEKIGNWEAFFQMYENVSNTFGMVGSGIPMASHDIAIRPGGDYAEYHLYEELFGKDGKAVDNLFVGGVNQKMNWLASGGGSGGMEERMVGNYIAERIQDFRGNQLDDVAELLGNKYGAESIVGILGDNHLSFEETTLNTEGLSRKQYIEGLAAQVKLGLGEELTDKETGSMRQVSDLMAGTSLNPFANPGTVSQLSRGHRASGFSVDPIYGGNITSRAVDKNTALTRYTQQVMNAYKGSAQFAGMDEHLLPVIKEITNYIETGQRDPEALGKKLIEMTTKGDARNFIVIDDFLDSWSTDHKGPDLQTNQFLDHLRSEDFKGDQELVRGVSKTYNEMETLKGMVSSIWNATTGGKSMHANQYILEGQRDHFRDEIVAHALSKTADFEGTAYDSKDYAQDTMNKVWARLMSPQFQGMPMAVKEKIFKEMREEINKGFQVNENFQSMQQERQALEGLLFQGTEMIDEIGGAETALMNQLGDLRVQDAMDARLLRQSIYDQEQAVIDEFLGEE